MLMQFGKYTRVSTLHMNVIFGIYGLILCPGVHKSSLYYVLIDRKLASRKYVFFAQDF